MNVWCNFGNWGMKKRTNLCKCFDIYDCGKWGIEKMDSLLVQDHRWGQNGVSKWLFGCVVTCQNVEIQSKGGSWRELHHSRRTGTRERRQRWRIEQNKDEETWSVFELYLASCSPLASLSLSLTLFVSSFIYTCLGTWVVFLWKYYGDQMWSSSCKLEILASLDWWSQGSLY